jgi:hypothetical protein
VILLRLFNIEIRMTTELFLCVAHDVCHVVSWLTTPACTVGQAATRARSVKQYSLNMIIGMRMSTSHTNPWTCADTNPLKVQCVAQR